MFKMKYGYRLELQTSETIKLFSSTKILKDKAEVVEVVLVKCNLLDNQYYILLRQINLVLIS